MATCLPLKARKPVKTFKVLAPPQEKSKDFLVVEAQKSPRSLKFNSIKLRSLLSFQLLTVIFP